MATFADTNSPMVVQETERARARVEAEVDRRKAELRHEIVRHNLPITVADAAHRAIEAIGAGLRVDAAAWLEVAGCLVRGSWQ